MTTSSLPEAGIYVWNDLITDSDTVQNLINSDFQLIIPWSLHVRSTGDLVWNDTTLVSGRVYQTSDQAKAFADAIGQLTDAGKTVILSVGAEIAKVNGQYVNYDFTNLLTFLGVYNGQPVPDTNNMYQNFQALQTHVPGISGFDFDNEDLPDVPPLTPGSNAMISFAHLLIQLGYETVTFCPYANQGMWTRAHQQIEQIKADTVKRWNLQCYAGGDVNLPASAMKGWVDSCPGGAAAMAPGFGCTGSQTNGEMDPTGVENQYKAWAQDTQNPVTGLGGGFIWRYDDLQDPKTDANAYEQAIEKGISEDQ